VDCGCVLVQARADPPSTCEGRAHESPSRAKPQPKQLLCNSGGLLDMTTCPWNKEAWDGKSKAKLKINQKLKPPLLEPPLHALDNPTL